MIAGRCGGSSSRARICARNSALLLEIGFVS